MKKSYITNLIALSLTILGYFFENNMVFTVGIFALSGSITNTIAVYMLFEKVPFLYGSGVVENRFEEFKKAIYNLLMNQFFTKDNIERLFKNERGDKELSFKIDTILEKFDFTKSFDGLKEVVINSPFGGMINMLGGINALEPLKEPFIEKIKFLIIEVSKENNIKELISKNIQDKLFFKISSIITKRLDELTPKLVKQIVQNMIKEHLGWLVIWGGVFGGLIGLIYGLAT